MTGITLTGCVIMFAAFFVLHKISPASVPFDMKVIISGLLGSGVAVANFFFMGLTIQKIVSGEDEEQARKDMKASYRYPASVGGACSSPSVSEWCSRAYPPVFSKRRHQGAEYVWNDKCKTKSIERR